MNSLNLLVQVISTEFGGYEQNVGRPSKEKSSAELPTINKTDTRKELAKLAGDKKSELPKSDKPINPIHTTDEFAKLV